MSDIRLKYNDGLFDLDLGDGGDAIDDGLRTAVIISLFTDRLADAADPLPNDDGDMRGWWGDIYPQEDGDLIGSKQWMLSREKQTAEVLNRAEKYAAEALQWLLDDGVASEVKAVAENPRAEVLALYISIKRPDGTIIDYRFADIWEAENGI